MARPKKNISALVLDFIRLHPSSSSKEIDDGLGNAFGYATVKRTLRELIGENLIASSGRGKSTRYTISTAYPVINPVDTVWYFKEEIDERIIRTRFNHELIRETLHEMSLFTNDEARHLEDLHDRYLKNIAHLTKTEYTKELERLAIDLSWKSSQIEGNTYSLLETEQLLKEQQTAAGKTRDEATMLLNHKDAIDFIVAQPSYMNPLLVSSIEDIHSILVKELGIDRNVRNRKVGISGTNYTPLDNEFQIREALQDMCSLINQKENVFAKALLVLALISYIQPFSDGNKRTGRIVSNAILMNHNHCPLSFRTVDPVDYKKAMLIFYEQNNISAVKRIFMEQFEFAVNTYF